jgi:hypothetical protein
MHTVGVLALGTNVVPIAVAQSGFPWTAVLMGLLNLLIGGVLVAFVKAWPNLRKINNERDANLLTERAADMERMRARVGLLEGKIDEQEARHEADRSVDRHRINNLQACLNAVLMLIEATPDRAAEISVKIREMRASQMATEAAERSAIHQAKILAAKAFV